MVEEEGADKQQPAAPQSTTAAAAAPEVQQDEDKPPTFHGQEDNDDELAPGTYEQQKVERSNSAGADSEKKVYKLAPVPEEHGCYTYLPKGCPAHPEFVARKGGRWIQYEVKKGLHKNETLCLSKKESLDKWCEVDNVRMLWVPPGAPQFPTEKGCYVWLPGTCAKRGVFVVKDMWKRDEWGEKHADAAESEDKCLDRKTQFDGFCGTKSARMLWKRTDEHTDDGAAPVYEEEKQRSPHKKYPRLPVSKGCYMWLPTGCHAHKIPKARLQWLRDDWGEEKRRAADSTEACLSRKEAVDQYCDTNDVVMLRVVADEQRTKGYSQLIGTAGVSGTQAKEIFSTDSDVKEDDFEFLQEMMAEMETDDAEKTEIAPPTAAVTVVGVDEKAPEAPTLNGAPQIPENKGCYVWLPSGCKADQQMHARLHWKRDEWFEGHSEKACKARKAVFDKMCQVSDAVTLLVPSEATESDSKPAAATENLSDEALEKATVPPPDSVAAEATEGQGADAASQLIGRSRASAEEDLVVPAEEPQGANEAAVPDSAPALPDDAGCFVWLPSGCKGARVQRRWRRDSWGEANRGVKASAEACKARKHDFDHYCQVQDAFMLYRPEGPPPAAPEPSHIEEVPPRGAATSSPRAVAHRGTPHLCGGCQPAVCAFVAGAGVGASGAGGGGQQVAAGEASSAGAGGADAGRARAGQHVAAGGAGTVVGGADAG